MVAEDIRRAGLGCFPCDPSRKIPMVDKGEDWRRAALKPLAQLRQSTVWGVPVPVGVVIIDLDIYKGVTRGAVEAVIGRVPWEGALIQHTQSGGEHYAFRAPGWSVTQTNGIAGVEGFDTRVGGIGYIATGQGYTPSEPFGVLAMANPAMLPPLPDTARNALEAREKIERKSAGPRADDDHVRAALSHIDPQCSRGLWLNIGLAIKNHDPDGGFGLFDEWSRGDLTGGETPSNYSPGDMGRQWRSFKPTGGITIKTLFYEAIKRGWAPPSTFDASTIFGGDKGALIDDVLEHGGDPHHTSRLAALVASDTLLQAVLTRELKDAGLLTPELKAALKPSGTGTPPGEKPAPGQCLPHSTPMSPEMWDQRQVKGKFKTPKGTLDNLVRMLTAYGVTVRYNEVSKDIEVSGAGIPTSGAMYAEAALAYLDHVANLNEYPKQDIRSFLAMLANRNSYNPVTQYISSYTWDGRDHIQALFNCLQLEDGEDADTALTLFRKWILGAVAIGTGMVKSFEFVLVLVDPQGGLGKTRFFETLAPECLRKPSVLLDVADKDSVKLATGYWLTELGELEGTFSRSEQTRLKAFLSSEFDEMRLPYARSYVKYPRRTAFFATVNSTAFLTDNSGNRRYWPVRVRAVDYQHDVNMGQMWAQAKRMIEDGHIWYLTPEENRIVANRNDGFKARTRVEDGLSVAIDPMAERTLHMTASAILARVGVPNASKMEINEAATWLRKKGFVECKRRGVRGFAIPPIGSVTAIVEFGGNKGAV